MNSRIALQIQKIDYAIGKIEQDYKLADAELQKKFGIKDQHFDYNYESWTDADWEYQEHHAEIYYKMQTQTDTLNAKKAVKMLLGYNIAHRGKPLHECAILKKLKKLNSAESDFIRSQMEQSVSFNMILGQDAHLHQELYKYGITLFDFNHYLMLQRKQAEIEIRKKPSPAKRKALERNSNKLKFFRSGIHKKYQSLFEPLTK